LKQQTVLLSLLAMAIAVTVGCGNSTSSANTFTKIALLSNRTVTPPTPFFTANLDGSNVTPIPSTLPIGTQVWSLSTSADGKAVAFIARNAGAFQLWTGKADGSAQHAFTTLNDPRWARISPNGKQIAYNENSVPHIFVINADGSGNLDLTPTLPTGMTSCYDPSFSADGSQVVFTCDSFSTGVVTGIYTVKADGTGLKTVEVRANGDYSDFAFLAPDGKKIVFYGSLGANSNVVLSVNIDGTGETILVPSANEVVLLNSSLYYEDSCNAPGKIFKADLDAKNPVQVTDGTDLDDLYFAGGCN